MANEQNQIIAHALALVKAAYQARSVTASGVALLRKPERSGLESNVARHFITGRQSGPTPTLAEAEGRLQWADFQLRASLKRLGAAKRNG